MSTELVWLITGTTSGLGREMAIAALNRGDKVIATGRNMSSGKCEDLRSRGADLIELDVTAPLPAIQEIAQRAVSLYGKVDVLINNAGYAELGTLEETTVNVFGPLNVARVFLPYMRQRKTGTIVFVGSVTGWRASPYSGLYSSTKWSLRGLSETLHEEISPLGLRSICIDFGYFRTPMLQPGRRQERVERIVDYKEIVDAQEERLQRTDGNQPGDPVKAAEVVISIVRGEGVAAGKPFPNSLALGTDCYVTAKASAEKALTRLNDWREASSSTDF
ncbi:short chain dehydrogenase [Agrocybe pediades]|nr:short chain dehydrogenase [Agrocybe pediades]